ncbi:hypothetical protein G1C97_1879 [Bifidobacterium sp. DSM 109959]|uniref:Uncharacterized protein n=1 Tax=Bifidobacterium olomucense TaxID=2675324 RepID=A0A7Y0F0U2_9BIFI|nr:hypothetical protein [Bifidobacterium sp. DSM 109959]
MLCCAHPVEFLRLCVWGGWCFWCSGSFVCSMWFVARYPRYEGLIPAVRKVYLLYKGLVVQ